MPLDRPLLFGEILHDCFPDGSRVLGGAPFNVAWHLRALGLDPYLVSRIGDDDAGRAVLQAMREWSLDAAGLQIDTERPTGQVAVRIDDGEPHFDIVADQAYDRIAQPAEPPPDIGLLYHGTLALRDRASRHALARLRESLPAPVFIDVNLRDPWWDAALVSGLLGGWPVARILQRAQWLASGVCGLRGALSADRAFYRAVTTRWDEP